MRLCHFLVAIIGSLVLVAVLLSPRNANLASQNTAREAHRQSVPRVFEEDHDNPTHTSENAGTVSVETHAHSALVDNASEHTLPFSRPADVAKWLHGLKGRYTILRIRRDFPNYVLGQDLDVLTELSPKSAVQLWFDLSFQKANILPGWRLHAATYKCHLHVDLLKVRDGKERIGFRFDLLNSLKSCYRSLPVHPEYTADVLRRSEVTVRHGDVYWVPSSSDDRALRYLEHVENPAKKRLLESIQQMPKVPFQQPEAHQAVPYRNSECPAKYEPPAVRDSELTGFLLWGHASDKLNPFLEVLHQMRGFEVHYVLRRNLSDVEQFVSEVYRPDLARLGRRHIQDKTRYLLKVPHMVWFLLAEETTPIKRYLDSNEMELVSVKVLALKWKLRAAWNPRLRRAKHHASVKLPPLVSHDHVLHAPDNEGDLRHVMECLNLSSPEHYRPKVLHGLQGVPWHVDFTAFNRQQRVALSTVKTYLHGIRGVFHLEDTPHVAYARGTKGPYIQYWTANAGLGLTDDHSPAKFDRLLAHFNATMVISGPALALVNRK
eukprot:EG_transcript_8982